MRFSLSINYHVAVCVCVCVCVCPSDQMQGTVTLRNISTSTSGLYQCTSSNAIGKSTCLLNLQVVARKYAPLLSRWIHATLLLSDIDQPSTRGCVCSRGYIFRSEKPPPRLSQTLMDGNKVRKSSAWVTHVTETDKQSIKQTKNETGTFWR